VVGAATAIYSASIGLVQNDFKRVLAYSTVSQLGYMFLAAGVGAFSAAIFHLMTHAFFKALLFLAAGSVLHALHHEGNIQVMGGLKRYMPWTYWTFFAACLAIAGIPGFSGFFSKDEILWKAFSSPFGHWTLWLIGTLAAGMTAFYMFRLLFLVFYGECRYFAYAEAKAHDHHHNPSGHGHGSHEGHAEIHESPRVMTIPLAILAVLSVVGGYVGVPEALGGRNWFHHFLEPVFAGAAHGGGHASAGMVDAAHAAAAHPSVWLEYLLMATSVAVALGGIGLAYHFYIRDPEAPRRLAQRLRGLYQMVFNKYYVDELYDFLFVRHTLWWARSSWWFDEKGVDGMVNGSGWTTVLGSRLSGLFDVTWVDGAVDGIGQIIQSGARNFRIVQTGLVQNYALAMLMAVFAMVSLYLLW
jgi:NADH-quinone oxidoreductase subunit L